MSRYARQMMLPELGTAGQARLAEARVLVIGAGGLAATVLPLLAGAGVGHLTVMDGDIVDRSNLHRQHLFAEGDIGRPKAEIAVLRCIRLNSEIQAAALCEALTPANAPSLVASHDLVVDCADSYAASYTLSDVCLAQDTPLISASALAFGGYVGGFCSTVPSLRAVFPDAPANAASCATAGVMGPVVSMLGALQAQMVLAVLAGIEPVPLGQMVQLDAKTYRFSSFRFDGAPEPEQAFIFEAASALTTEDTIIELRDEAEAPIPIHPSAIRMAPGALKEALTPTNGRLAIACSSGLRAWRAAEELHPIWPGEIVLVAAATS